MLGVFCTLLGVVVVPSSATKVAHLLQFVQDTVGGGVVDTSIQLWAGFSCFRRPEKSWTIDFRQMEHRGSLNLRRRPRRPCRRQSKTQSRREDELPFIPRARVIFAVGKQLGLFHASP